MRIIENVEKVVVTEQLAGVICNSCGESVETNELNSVQEINFSFGYGSEFDGQNWHIDLCEKCIKNLTKNFKVVPDKFMSDPFNISSFDSNHELHQDMFDKWKINEEWDNKNENVYSDYCGENEVNSYEDYEEPETEKPLHNNLRIVK